MRLDKTLRFAALFVLIAASVPAVAHGTPYWTDKDAARAGIPAAPLIEPFEGPPVALRDVSEYVTELGRIASFLRTWQVDNEASPDFGGIREGEHLPNIIQTDNTSEAIWVWTRYYELTGDDTYHTNILRAFTYSLHFPAYNEEGGESANLGYYRMYNCGWAVRAEAKYRDIYGDATYKAYADACAAYLRSHTLNRFGNEFYDNVNLHVLSWAMGNLHHYGVHEANADWIAHAAQEAGAKPKAWIEANPTLMANETWAMAGGATAWGLLHSYFLEHPDEAAAWLALYKDYMDTFASAGDFTNAWNGWYALGHRAIGLALADPEHLATYINLTEYLIDEDADLDGGVPARPQDTDQMDQTWVSNYLAFMGLSDGIGPASDVAAGSPALGGPLVLVSPNPVPGGSCAIEVGAMSGGPVRFLVSDVAGRTVQRFTGDAGSAGSRIAWNTAELPSGAYWLRAQGAREQAVTRVQIVR